MEHHNLQNDNDKNIKIEHAHNDNDKNMAENTDSIYEKSFRSYLNERDTIKKNLYLKASLIGLLIALVSFAVNLAFFGFDNSYQTLFIFIVVLTSFTRVFGICMFSIVPTSEVDIVATIVERYILRRFFIIFCFCGWLLWGLLFLLSDSSKSFGNTAVVQVIYPFFASLRFLQLIWRNEKRYEEILPSVQLIFLYMLYYQCFNLVICTQERCSTYLIASYVIYIPFLLYRSYHIIQRYKEVKESISSYSILPCENTSRDKECIKNYNVSLVYYQIYELCLLFSPQSFIFGMDYVAKNRTTRAYVWFLVSLFDLLPIVGVAYLGDKFCFSLLARFFEFSVKQQQKDGAVMAALISKCQVHPYDKSNRRQVLWIKRSELDCLERKDGANYIERGFWVKTTIEKTQDKYFYVRVDYQIDTNIRLKYRYENETLVFEESFDYGDVTSTVDFNNWAKYFEKYNPSRDEDLQAVCFWYPETPPVTVTETDSSETRLYKDETELQKKQREMLKWGRGNLRKFHSKNFFETTTPTSTTTTTSSSDSSSSSSHGKLAFRDDLFKTSPRELSNWSVEEKKKLHDLSEPVIVKTRLDKIDYFISHAWADNAENKCYAMRYFIGSFSTVSRKPSFWLDKVCIDQNDTTKGIECLPINIGACKKILILMGKEYMTRLWCIWELFMLFTFCNRELGLERLRIVCIDDDIDFAREVENFSIDKAHAFDPNEEYRLRYIMLKVVGEEKIKEIFSDLLTLVSQGKISTITKKTTTKLSESSPSSN